MWRVSELALQRLGGTLTNTGRTPARVRSTVPMTTLPSMRAERDPRALPGSAKLPHSRICLRLTKGIHLVVDRARLPCPTPWR